MAILHVGSDALSDPSTLNPFPLWGLRSAGAGAVKRLQTTQAVTHKANNLVQHFFVILISQVAPSRPDPTPTLIPTLWRARARQRATKRRVSAAFFLGHVLGRTARFNYSNSTAEVLLDKKKRCRNKHLSSRAVYIENKSAGRKASLNESDNVRRKSDANISGGVAIRASPQEVYFRKNTSRKVSLDQSDSDVARVYLEGGNAIRVPSQGASFENNYAR